jgi:hypothetical protein
MLRYENTKPERDEKREKKYEKRKQFKKSLNYVFL